MAVAVVVSFKNSLGSDVCGGDSLLRFGGKTRYGTDMRSSALTKNDVLQTGIQAADIGSCFNSGPSSGRPIQRSQSR